MSRAASLRPIGDAATHRPPLEFVLDSQRRARFGKRCGAYLHRARPCQDQLGRLVATSNPTDADNCKLRKGRGDFENRAHRDWVNAATR